MSSLIPSLDNTNHNTQTIIELLVRLKFGEVFQRLKPWIQDVIKNDFWVIPVIFFIFLYLLLCTIGVVLEVRRRDRLCLYLDHGDPIDLLRLARRGWHHEDGRDTFYQDWESRGELGESAHEEAMAADEKTRIHKFG